MVEGGQRVISSFMAAREVEDDQPVVDVVIVTVAPTLVGADGIGVALEEAKASNACRERVELMLNMTLRCSS